MMDSSGILKYSINENGSAKLIVDIDQGIVDVLFALTPKSFKLKRQMFPGHISVVRNESFKNEMWGVHEGEVIHFKYDPITRNNETYHWIRVWSERLIEIRTELGLTAHSEITKPPDDELCFHITIGNTKNK